MAPRASRYRWPSDVAIRPPAATRLLEFNMPCQAFLDLKESYTVADKQRLSAVGDLIEFAGRVEHAAFEKLKRAVKDTSDICLAAWHSMEEHRKEHRCDLTVSKARAVGSKNFSPRNSRVSFHPEDSSLQRGRLR